MSTIFYVEFEHAPVEGAHAMAMVNTGAAPIKCRVVGALCRTAREIRVRLRRYDNVFTGGTARTPKPLPDIATSPDFAILEGTTSVPLVSAGAETFVMTGVDATSGAHRSAGIQPCADNTCSIAPGHTMTLTFLDADSETYTVCAWIEQQ
jgi:hypothetical protein